MRLFTRGRGRPEIADLVARAIDLDVRGLSAREIHEMLRAQGASAEQAREARAKAHDALETEVAGEAREAGEAELPGWTALPVNFYFVLGVTPRAGAEVIRRAYRAKLKLVHPDQHQALLAGGPWDELTRFIHEVNRVLGDARLRAAYNVLWLERSHELRGGDTAAVTTRSDWETRLLWEMAEIGAVEDALLDLLEARQEGPAGDRLARLAFEYAERQADLAFNLPSLPEELIDLERRLRAELGGMARLSAALERLAEALAIPESSLDGAAGAECLRVLREVRRSHHLFDVGVATRALSQPR